MNYIYFIVFFIFGIGYIIIKNFYIIQFKINFLRLKYQCKTLFQLNAKYDLEKTKKEKFFKFFIKDEVDERFNKILIEDFDKKISKYKYKIYIKENKIRKILFELKFIDLNYLSNLQQYDLLKYLSDNDLKLIIKIVLYFLKTNDIKQNPNY